MKTSKPFSTISYNSTEFLKIKLDELYNRHTIDFYAWVEHLPEEDESKAHKHLYIVPNGKIDSDQLLEFLQEFDPLHPDKPLRCMRPHSSKFADWYLYALHDTAYLASKGQARKYHYQQSEFMTADNDYFLEEIHTIDFAKLNRFASLRDAAQQGIPFEELLLGGSIPIQQTFAYRQAYELMARFKTDRAQRIGHQKVDPNTGEIVYDD